MFIAGTIAIVAVVTVAAVSVAAVTDTYSWVSSGEFNAYSGNVDNKVPLYVEELIGEIAIKLRA